jgi:uncharacterized protein (DUF2252 family)
VKIEPCDRAAVLHRRRQLKMARSVHAYVRGNTAQFYQWLAESDAGGKLPHGPPVWICGDCHLGNLGPLADEAGRVAVQIRDLDQSVIGNPAHDLIRLGLSLASAARGSSLPGVTTARMIEEMVDGYELAMTDTDDAAPEPGVVRAVRRRALGRRWKHLARERLADVRPAIPLGRKFWALDKKERAAIEALVAEKSIRRMILSLNARDDDDSVSLVDAAYWMKGCSSLGALRYAVLVAIGDPDTGMLALIDLKEAVPAVAPAAPGAKMPRDHAKRVVAGARALSPNLGERMQAARLLGKPVVVRELMPQDLKLEIDQFSRRQATGAARYLANVVGRAHARQMDGPTRDAWCATLRDYHGGGLEAPSWLWNGVVDLMARHESGYLDHCRRFALEDG